MQLKFFTFFVSAGSVIAAVHMCVCVSCAVAIKFAFNLQLSKRLKLISATLIKLGNKKLK